MQTKTSSITYQELHLAVDYSSRDNATWLAIRELRLSLQSSLLTLVSGEAGLAKASLIASVTQEIYTDKWQFLNCEKYLFDEQQEILSIIVRDRKKYTCLIVKVAPELLMDERATFLQNIKKELSKTKASKLVIFCDTSQVNQLNTGLTDVIIIPPLRQRLGDILPIVRKVLPKNVTVDIQVISSLLCYEWPLNIKELLSVIGYAYNMLPTKQYMITTEQIKMGINDVTIAENNLYEHQDAIEKQLIIKAMQLTNNNITQAAIRLGVKRQALQYKLKKYEIN